MIDITQVVINLRYALMSISLSQKVDERFRGVYRALLGFGITDEIFAVAMNHGNKISRKYFLGLMCVPYIGWASGTLCGSICGNVLPNIISEALGISLFGMFIAIVVPSMKHSRRIAIVVILAISIRCILEYVPIFSGISSGFAIIVCSVIAAGIGAILFPDTTLDEELT